MKSKDKETLKNHSVEELRAELKQAREKRFGLSFKHSATPLKNPLELRVLRRRIAMLETFIKEKAKAAASK